MDIGPVSAIRPVTAIRPSPGSPDLSRVSETQHRSQPGDDDYTPAHRKASRGLEDEEEVAATEQPPTPPPAATSTGKVNFFA